MPAHVVIALLALVGVGSVWAIRIVQSLVATRRLPVVAPVWRRTFIATGIALVATVAWGLFTGHGVGPAGRRRACRHSTRPGARRWPSSPRWRRVPRHRDRLVHGPQGARRSRPDLYLGTGALLVAGALVWGARLGDFNTFHVFFAGIAVFATPVAAVAVWSIWLRLRATGHAAARDRRAGAVRRSTRIRRRHGRRPIAVLRAREYPPVPVAILAEIRSLPPDAKLAYACSHPRSSPSGIRDCSAWTPTPAAHRADVLPGETLRSADRRPKSADVASPLFRVAPQRTLYPDAGAQPSAASVVAFLKANGIDYIYADAMHPNTLVPGAIPIATSGETQVLRLP